MPPMLCNTALSGSEGDCVAAWRDEAASLQKPSVSPCHQNHLGKELIPQIYAVRKFAVMLGAASKPPEKPAPETQLCILWS